MMARPAESCTGSARPKNHCTHQCSGTAADSGHRTSIGSTSAVAQVDTGWRGALTYNQMVADELADESLDLVFHALADATRRDILRRCTQGVPSVSRLALTYPMSFAAVQKHVAVLERAGLVTKERKGREALVRTDLTAVGRARQALDEFEVAWRGRVDRMSRLLAEAADE
jgi:DNA-binding transcriptional ArsR family regulator